MSRDVTDICLDGLTVDLPIVVTLTTDHTTTHAVPSSRWNNPDVRRE